MCECVGVCSALQGRRERIWELEAAGWWGVVLFRLLQMCDGTMKKDSFIYVIFAMLLCKHIWMA